MLLSPMLRPDPMPLPMLRPDPMPLLGLLLWLYLPFSFRKERIGDILLFLSPPCPDSRSSFHREQRNANPRLSRPSKVRGS